MNNNIKVKKTIFKILVLVLLVLAIVIVFVIRKNNHRLFLNQIEYDDVYKTTRIEDYGIFENFNGYSKLDIFPETLEKVMKVDHYLYEYEDTLFDPTAQIYLECSFDDENYNEEIARLESIYEEYKGQIQKVIYDTENFLYPAYVTINGNNHCYEYALLLENNKIAYIFLQFIDKENIAFSSNYLPTDFENKNEKGYSMYLFLQKDGSGIGTY